MFKRLRVNMLGAAILGAALMVPSSAPLSAHAARKQGACVATSAVFTTGIGCSYMEKGSAKMTYRITLAERGYWFVGLCTKGYSCATAEGYGKLASGHLTNKVCLTKTCRGGIFSDRITGTGYAYST
jgi:hypothetical protein